MRTKREWRNSFKKMRTGLLPTLTITAFGMVLPWFWYHCLRTRQQRWKQGLTWQHVLKKVVHTSVLTMFCELWSRKMSNSNMQNCCSTFFCVPFEVGRVAGNSRYRSPPFHFDLWLTKKNQNWGIIMKTLNLRDYHPSLYTSDCFIEVSDEVEDIFITSKQNEDAYHSRKYITRHNISLIGTMVLNTIF